LKLIKELKDTDGEIRKAVIEVLKEINAPPGQHPADKLTAAQDMLRQQAMMTIQQQNQGGEGQSGDQGGM